jgi:hypothetical protein
MKTLLITPPLLQPNTPYPATPLLTAWLRSQGHDAVQADLSLELLLRLFSAAGVGELCRALETSAAAEEAAGFLEAEVEYRDTVDQVLLFLQGRSPQAAEKLSRRGVLPEGPYLVRAYEQDEQFGWNFRGIDPDDRARHLASLYLDDLAEAAGLLDPQFGFSRYAEHLAAALPGFGKIRAVLEQPHSLFFQWLEKLTDEKIARHHPDAVALTVPFPGCLLGALSIARRIKQTRPDIQILLGGGYVNTELRGLSDSAVFDYVDFITLDSGMLPLARLIGKADSSKWVRTFARKGGVVRFFDCAEKPVGHNDLPPPIYDGLPLDRYFGLFEMLNPVTRLWSDGRWNKLVLAHGCCWGRCAFCDTSIDYICRYDPATPAVICDWMETMMAESGFNGFHFVDEALPHDLLEGLCDEILRRGLSAEWWGNIRFEQRFSSRLVQKMAAAGCIAVTGGLETCCDRTLQLMRKGITVKSAVDVIRRFADGGILTHAYLMYGFPTQTLEETFRALETIRDLVDSGALHSAYWHRFALTAHSEAARHPDRFSIRLPDMPPPDFARNEIPFDGVFDYDLAAVGESLCTATYNYLHGVGLELPVSHWWSKNQGERFRLDKKEKSN